MRIILVAGMPGSGKEELLTVARGMGIPFVRMGDLVREAYAEAGGESTGMTIGQFANSEREAKGRDVWARRAVERMGGDMFLVDGCRSMDEVRSYRNVGDEVTILGIYASPGDRYARLIARGRDDAPRTPEEFSARDSREMGWGLDEVLAMADRMILNDSDLESFRIRAAETLGAMM